MSKVEAEVLPLGAGIEISFRKKGDNSSEYSHVVGSGLDVRCEPVSGDGSPENPFAYDLIVKNNGQAEWEGIIRVDLSVGECGARYFMPAFLYGKNRGEVDRLPGSGLFPRLREGEVDIPYSPYWMVRGDRLSHPISLMHVDGMVFGISACPYLVKDGDAIKPWFPGGKGEFHRFNGFCCSMENGSSVGFTIGYENAPVLYVESLTIKEREQLGGNCICLEKGAEISIPIHIYAFEAADARGINNAMRNVYKLFHESPGRSVSPIEGIRDISQAIYEDAYIREIRNYSTQVYFDHGRMVMNPLASISWTGGVEIAAPLLVAALRLDREDMREQALECIQYMVENSMNGKSGLPFDAFSDGQWTVKGWWGEYLAQSGHSSYLVGQALYYILKAYDYEKRLKGVEHADWLQFVDKVLKRIEKTKNAEKEYPYLWSEETGEGIEYDAFSGCWCMAALAYLAKIRKDPDLLSSCRESEEHYFNKFVKHMECYGTPHDTWKAVDSEGILAYIKAVKILHEETAEPKYMERLKDGLEYEFTFKFSYNPPILVPPLSKLKWSCSGGTVTSTCNPHIHQMSNNVLDELHYYFEKTRDEYFRTRLQDTLYWGLQAYNRFDQEFDFGKKGWMTERYCYSEAYTTDRYPDGGAASVWFCFLPWGSSNVLEGMCGDLWMKINRGEPY